MMLSPLPSLQSAPTKTGSALQTEPNLACCQTAAEYSTAGSTASVLQVCSFSGVHTRWRSLWVTVGADEMRMMLVVFKNAFSRCCSRLTWQFFPVIEDDHLSSSFIQYCILQVFGRCIVCVFVNAAVLFTLTTTPLLFYNRSRPCRSWKRGESLHWEARMDSQAC